MNETICPLLLELQGCCWWHCLGFTYGQNMLELAVSLTRFWLGASSLRKRCQIQMGRSLRLRLRPRQRRKPEPRPRPRPRAWPSLRRWSLLRLESGPWKLRQRLLQPPKWSLRCKRLRSTQTMRWCKLRGLRCRTLTRPSATFSVMLRSRREKGMERRRRPPGPSCQGWEGQGICQGIC